MCQGAGEFLANVPVKMNAAAEVLRLRHWPPRGVYTRWRPRKRFCSGIVCIPPTSARNLAAPRFAVCSKLYICGLFFAILQTSIPLCRGCKAIRTSEFQNGTLAQRCARVHRMPTPARVVGRFPVSPSPALNRGPASTDMASNSDKPTSQHSLDENHVYSVLL